MFCHALIKAIKSQTAIADPNATNSVDIDFEPSTPDDGVEPVSVVSHLAEQEHSFSDDSAEFTMPEGREEKVTAQTDPQAQAYVVHSENDEPEELEHSHMLPDTDQAHVSVETTEQVPDVKFADSS